MNDLGSVLTALVPQLLALLGLSLAQVILGVAVALKNKIFEWQKLADFFSTIIAPRILTWVACMIIVLMVPSKYLPVELTGGIQTVTFLAIVLSFTGSIIANLRALGVLSDSFVLDRIGLPAKTPVPNENSK
jgi:hypothetical protein